MSETIKAWDAFELIALPLRGAGPIKGLKRGQATSAGELLAVQPDPSKGDVHASWNGLVEEINEFEIVIRREDEAVGRPPEPKSFHALHGFELAGALKALGVDIPLVQPGDPIIINTLNPEPGLSLAPPLFGEQRKTILAGLEAAARLWPGHGLKWAVGRREHLSSKAEGLVIETVYPLTLPALIKKKLLGLNDPSASGVLGGRELFLLGRAWRTRLPLTISPLTLAGSNYFIPLGARIIDLLTFANLAPGPGDAVIKGGLVRGQALSRLERGLDQSAAALHLVRGAEAASAYEPCRQCSECARACPAGLPVNRPAGDDPQNWLGRRTWPELEACLVCGACALACPSRRPLMSLVRLARAGGRPLNRRKTANEAPGPT